MNSKEMKGRWFMSQVMTSSQLTPARRREDERSSSIHAPIRRECNRVGRGETDTGK